MGLSSSSDLATEENEMNKRDALSLEKVAKIKDLYHTGIPFFTKDSIRDVQQQLVKAEPGDEVSVLNLDGTKSKFTISIGKVVDGFEPEMEMVQTDAHISYQTIQSMTRINGFNSINFCPMPISHSLDLRNKVTKELDPRSAKRADLPREEAEEFFDTCCREWEASEPCKQLRSILASAEIPLGITKIVAFACSKFSCIIEKPQYFRGLVRPATQHALILTLRSILSKRNAESVGEITCYAQDPAYSSLDKEILEKSGIKIFNDPEGFLEVDESTVVLSFCSNVCVRQVVTDLARPAMMIWDRIQWDKDEMGGKPKTDPDSPRLKRMIQEFYDEFEMPDNSSDERRFFGGNIGNAGIYIRKTNTASHL